MGNLSSHKGVRVCKRIESRVAELVCLPRYSPDLPDRDGLSKIKQKLRSLAGRAVARDQNVLDAVALSDAVNCFKHCDYSLNLD